ncbi:hypothetical protein H7F50_03265 [Novosphingobium flavum]|uniref:Twin-arginine translocation signal domain-containing protein n=1 Tax=Novosphingobium aerophilum TaxID=2839843 RepID=A0A7X1KBE0_9SPHN|nr:hypothetical protein [Novosphingobium aerophilum]MBC2651201.1 hypothetical protein [Novosphingobium aerophilum]MBC2660758.1 hypothetical protein [Novosphingobium aerophilum]
MRLDRRKFVKASAAVSALSGLGATARAATQAPALVIYDSRLSESCAFADRHGALKFDIAAEHGQLWRGMRSGLPAGRVIGLTRWSDLVIVRGYAGEQGKRLRHHRKLGRLFVWELV